MVVIVLCFVIVLLLFLMLMQNFRRQRLQHSDKAQQGRRGSLSKPQKQRVSYLEPKVSADVVVEGSVLSEEINESAVEAVTNETTECETDLSESADEVLGLSAKPVAATDELLTSTISNQVDQPSEVKRNKLDDLIVLYLKSASNKPYAGYELLQSILSSGLRYGDRQVFHRYESDTARTNVLFSLASAVGPHTFDLPRMGGYSTTGLCFYFSLSDQKDPMEAFEAMLHTAGQLSEDLGGKVLDNSRQLLTKETVREICLRIRRHEKDMTNYDLFADTVTN